LLSAGYVSAKGPATARYMGFTPAATAITTNTCTAGSCDIWPMA
jgi:hypothetical protein